jgi:curved DNA-binding protein CbpA
MADVNLYDVLNVKEDCSTKDIKLAYRDLVKVYHPDKSTGDKEMFELITQAYNILVNPKNRAEYDNIYALSKQVEDDFISLQKKARTYAKAQENDEFKKSDAELKEEFEKAFSDMDKTHGFKRNHKKELGENEINPKEASRMYNDLRTAREQDEIEFSHDRIFDGSVDLGRFNEAFDNLYKGSNEVIPHTGAPIAFNEIGGLDSNFSSVNDVGALYVDDSSPGNGSYSNVNFEQSSKRKITKQDLVTMKSATYVEGHNNIPQNYGKTLEERLKEREFQSKQFDTRTMNDFSNDPACGGYGIFNPIGVKGYSTLNWKGGEDLKSRYERLIESRRNDNTNN